MGVTLTEKAAVEVKRVMEEQEMAEDICLRVAARGGGCSGFEYVLTFDEKATDEKDDIQEMHGVKLAVDRQSMMALEGTSVDYYDGLEKRGFVFNNPNATKTCGCGSSFSV